MTEFLSLTSSELSRFNAFLDKNDAEHPGCWIWTGAKAKGGGRAGRYYRGKGYPIFQATTLVPKTRRAHRLAYQIWNGPIPEGLQIQHTCDNPWCCNPDHLRLGTPKSNSAQMVRKGRMPTGLEHGRATLSTETVQQIHALCEAGQSYASVARQFGISEGHARNIHRGRRRISRHDPQSFT